MSRTTPPRPYDVAAIFPELREHSATATRLSAAAGLADRGGQLGRRAAAVACRRTVAGLLGRRRARRRHTADPGGGPA
ncbi:hypothetical protein [Actinoplanes italicus]|uniref:hypothetical protein n=1 Tax=Actinoplanes italicus TaxID=113567 RepID=UPI0019437F5D|nr:hypothetical protein [Actinoplanes italicus]